MCCLSSDVKLPKYNKNKLRLFRMIISAKNAELFFHLGHVRDVQAFECFINREVIMHAMRRAPAFVILFTGDWGAAARGGQVGRGCHPQHLYPPPQLRERSHRLCLGFLIQFLTIKTWETLPDFFSVGFSANFRGKQPSKTSPTSLLLLCVRGFFRDTDENNTIMADTNSCSVCLAQMNKPNTAAVNSILFVRAIHSMFVNCAGQQRRLYTGLKMSDHRGRGGPQAGGPGTHTHFPAGRGGRQSGAFSHWSAECRPARGLAGGSPETGRRGRGGRRGSKSPSRGCSMT